jgi:hypothetical protein
VIIGDNDVVLDSDSETVMVCKPSLVTDSMLCSLTNDQFKLVYTPDQNAQGSWKLNASNPGQYYYNVFYTGSGDEDITITLPYPFVTQGAVPIHVYSDVGVATNSRGQTCLTPMAEMANESDQADWHWPMGLELACRTTSAVDDRDNPCATDTQRFRLHQHSPRLRSEGTTG